MYDWFKCFENGQKFVDDNEHSETSTSITPGNVIIVWNTVVENHKQTNNGL